LNRKYAVNTFVVVLKYGEIEKFKKEENPGCGRGPTSSFRSGNFFQRLIDVFVCPREHKPAPIITLIQQILTNLYILQNRAPGTVHMLKFTGPRASCLNATEPCPLYNP
jgi:hypothetical protein